MNSSFSTDYIALYRTANAVLGNLTPLGRDCGVLCGKACCKGSDTQGMRLFPHEDSPLKQTTTAQNGILAACDGSCDRAVRPLACRIFPLFPYVHQDGHISAEIDVRGIRLCPLVSHADVIRFDPKFIRAVRKVGRLLARDPEIFEYLKEVSSEIDLFRKFHNYNSRPSMRIGSKR